MKVVLVFRSKNKGGKSIEGIFQRLMQYSTPQLEIQTWEVDPEKSLIRNIATLRRIKADVYHITGDITFFTCFLLFRKVMVTFHDIGRYKELWGIRKWIFGLLWIRWPVRLAKLTTTVSQFTKQDILARFPSAGGDRIQVIHNGYNPVFSPESKEFNTACPRVLQVGTAIHKNLETVIAAVSALDCVLVIIGHLLPSQFELLKKNQIRFENYTDVNLENLRTQYQKSDIVVFVSAHEGFGMPVIEAQAMGRPVITSRMASLPEIAGQGALYVENYRDAEEVRAGIKKIMLDTRYRDELIKKGFENAARFTYDKMAGQYLTLYAKTVAL